MNPIPPRPLPLLDSTCSRSIFNTSLSFHRAGTGRYAGLKVPTVCAHSPGRGDCCVAGSTCVPCWDDAGADGEDGEEGLVEGGEEAEGGSASCVAQ